MHLIESKTCRACGSSALTPVVNLGEQHLQGSFVKPGKEIPPSRKISLSLVHCGPTKDERPCGFLEMEHTVHPEIPYSAYWCRSGNNDTMRRHLQGIADEAVGLRGKSQARVLHIGCNDGTLLSFYLSEFQKFGVDPADVAQEITENVTVVQDIFRLANIEIIHK